jgi:hypothetical protein
LGGFSVKKSLFFLALSLALMGLSAGCGLFSPQTSKATIQISVTDYNPSNGCSIQANLDGGTNVALGNGGVYTFPLASPGSHTVNFSLGGVQACNSNNCTITPSSDSFQVSGGNLYVVKLSENGSNCWQVVVTGPWFRRPMGSGGKLSRMGLAMKIKRGGSGSRPSLSSKKWEMI